MAMRRMRIPSFPLACRFIVHSDALEEARRRAFPATVRVAEGGAGDAAVCAEWREYWDSHTRRPYYVHAHSRELSWIPPVGFVTLHRNFWNASANVVVNDQGVVEKNGKETGAKESEHSRKGWAFANELKKNLAAYGAAGVVLYLTIHTLGFVVCFIALYVGGVDITAPIRRLGFDVKPPRRGGGLVTCTVAAIAMNKMMAPLQMLLTLALAPRIAPKLQPAVQTLVRRYTAWTGGVSSSERKTTEKAASAVSFSTEATGAAAASTHEAKGPASSSSP